MKKLYLVVVVYVDQVDKYYCTGIREVYKTIEKFKKDKYVEYIEYGETSYKTSNYWAMMFDPKTRVLAYEKEV